ncbi:pentapeptide repeat-containing protein, partial [Acinetobacter sp. CFCC 10889]|uniref:pentapeptide repeat-containing protein n=1 Tax=Acinetobacter sp. CFCC 10889 TaxID=1775557 RepID=UPI001BC8984C
MEIQNLRLQALHITDGDIEKAQDIENYVLGNQKAEKVAEPQAESTDANGNTGYCNTGNCNTGDRNTGDWNTGDRNTGYWNTGD